MNHQEENSGNPEYVQNCLLRSITKAIGTNIELSQGDLENMRNRTHHGVVINSIIYEVCFSILGIDV